MAVRDIFKVSRKTFFNPTSWIDLEALIYQNKTIWSVLKGLFTKPAVERTETFEEAMKRQDMTEADVTILTAAQQHRRKTPAHSQPLAPPQHPRHPLAPLQRLAQGTQALAAAPKPKPLHKVIRLQAAGTSTTNRFHGRSLLCRFP